MTEHNSPPARRGTPAARWRVWIRQPALHFLVLAGVLLVLDGAQSGAQARAPMAQDDAKTLERLRSEFQATEGRPMTAAEEREAVEKHRYEQTLFAAALSTGMHETDPIVRRRLVQRMQFLIEDVVQVAPATDEQLLALAERHPHRFPPTRNLSFDHVFFARSRHGAQLGAIAAEAREALLRGEEVQSDPFPRRLPTEEVSVPSLARAVGPKTAEAFFGAEEGAWSEPIVSGYGVHLVRVRHRTARPPALAEIRARASAVWEREERQRLGRQLIASLRDEP